jgi:hypothetical protein
MPVMGIEDGVSRLTADIADRHASILGHPVAQMRVIKNIAIRDDRTKLVSWNMDRRCDLQVLGFNPVAHHIPQSFSNDEAESAQASSAALQPVGRPGHLGHPAPASAVDRGTRIAFLPSLPFIDSIPSQQSQLISRGAHCTYNRDISIGDAIPKSALYCGATPYFSHKE